MQLLEARSSCLGSTAPSAARVSRQSVVSERGSGCPAPGPRPCHIGSRGSRGVALTAYRPCWIDREGQKKDRRCHANDDTAAPPAQPLTARAGGSWAAVT